MKLTCLSEGRGYHYPACHLLQMCGLRILLECPLDLSAVQLFLPLNFNFSNDNEQRMVVGNFKGCDSPFQKCQGEVLLEGEPMYRITTELHMWDISLIDIVLVSSPAGMLGLPFLTRNNNFTAKIYATEATSKVGQLMIEELLVMHLEFSQLYGPSSSAIPLWLNCKELKKASEELQERVYGKDATDTGNWHSLYSAADAKECMKRVHSLRFAEEICYNETLTIKPISSGLEIGASNWMVKGRRKSLTYLTESLIGTGHAMGLDICSLQGTDLVLFSGFSALSETDKPSEINVTSNKYEKSDRENSNKSAVSKFRYKFPVYRQLKSSAGISGVQGLESSNNSYSTPCLDRNSTGTVDSINLQEKQTDCSSSLNSKFEKSSQIGLFHNFNVCDTNVEKEKFDLICTSAIKAIEAGGSVLIPITRMGYILQLLEEVSSAVHLAGFRQVPIFYVSSTAEETLAFANTIPEWLNKQRQEKLYAGEALFGHVGLLADKRLHSFSALHSPRLIDVWQEPCIVFASHWSLRAGPTVHLLHRWHQNPNCLLVVAEGMIDIDLLLLPYKPMAMKLLQCPFPSGLRLNEIVPLLRKLQPKLVLFPEAFQKGVDKSTLKELSRLFYCKGQSLHVPSVKDEIEVDMATDLAFKLMPKQVGQGKSAVAKLEAELHIDDGRISLKSIGSSSASTSSLNQQSRQTQIYPDVLLVALRGSGMCASLQYKVESELLTSNSEDNDGGQIFFVVNISSPSKATIEVGEKLILIKADDAGIREHIFTVVNSIIYTI